MIFEELQKEIDQGVNRLVIDKVAGLLADPERWHFLLDFLHSVDVNKVFERDIVSQLRARYITAMRQYVHDKIEMSKALRQFNHYTYYGGDYTSHYYYRRFMEAEKRFELSKYNKSILRKEMIARDLDYKIYHNNERLK